MNNKELENIINKLNSGKSEGIFIDKSLSDFVVKGHIVLKHHSTYDDISKFYLIKNEVGIYVSIVNDIGSELHWFTVKKHRGKSYLTNALRQSILIDLIKNREIVKANINRGIGKEDFANSKRVAENVGFTLKYDCGGDYFMYEYSIN